MRVGDRGNLTIVLLRRRLFGAGRFDPAVVGGIAQAGRVHAADWARGGTWGRSVGGWFAGRLGFGVSGSVPLVGSGGVVGSDKPVEGVVVEEPPREPERVLVDVRYEAVAGSTHGQSRIILRSVDQPSMGTMVDLVG